MGGLSDAGAWGLAWAMLAAIACSGLAIAAALRARHMRAREPDWGEGYNALATLDVYR
ncbi:MAG TPA: hypothetical protein VG943_03975 [Caulobacterales bacterium]|nr:hypothetical protein [Caulobacterales bacterium]